MIQVDVRGNTSGTESWLNRLKRQEFLANLNSYGNEGVSALRAATPTDSGITAASWSFKITRTLSGAKIDWLNKNENDGVNIAVILQYGHGTRNGGYVPPRDYINPAMAPVFNRIVADVTKAVKNG